MRARKAVWGGVLIVAGVCWLAMASAVRGGADVEAAMPHRPELEYLKTVLAAGPAGDPQLIFLLMGQYANAGRPAEGAAFLAARREQYGAGLAEPHRALYLAAEAGLRAQAAAGVPFWRRIGWVRQTVAMLDEAQRLSGGELFVVRWMSGIVRAQLPGFFGERQRAIADLEWCLAHAEAFPHPGWLREVYYHRARLHRDAGEEARSRALLAASGYRDFDRPVALLTPYVEDPASGHRFAARRIWEPVPGKVYALHGFEFAEYYFFVTDDGRELVGVDAGTRPDAAQEAYEALRARYPALPPLTTIFVTHAHWDHVGGHRYFRGLQPAPKFIGRANYGEELAIQAATPGNLLPAFFGGRFRAEDVQSYRPDVAVDARTTMTVGGTQVELLPVDGGETHDALMVHLPRHGVVFAGDFIMPFMGAPFAEEGNVTGLERAIDVVANLQPKVLLHGHEPLNRLFPSHQVLTGLKAPLAWLQAQVTAGIRAGRPRAQLQQANLVPPGLAGGQAAIQLAYLVLRENVINRLYDQHVGYWQPDMQGMDAITRTDRGAMLIDYLGLSDAALVKAAANMMADGHHELAGAMLDAALERRPQSAELRSARRLAYLHLREKYQDINPFKFIIYSAHVGEPVPAVAVHPPAAQ